MGTISRIIERRSLMDQIFLHQFDVLLELRHFLSIILACLCGWAIGYERKSRNKQAGVKTHVIVALASALMMIVSKEAFLKRAQRHPKFNGYKAGIVVLRNEDIVKKDGQTLYPNEQLLAGWAEVYRKDIDYPVYVEVSLQEYSTGKSTWRTKPATMIRKVALVNALRETFPEDLGAMYTEEESLNNHNSQSGTQVEKPKKIVNNLAEEYKQQNAIEEDTKPKVIEEVKPKEIVAVQTELDMVEANRSAYEKEQELKGTREHDIEADEQ